MSQFCLKWNLLKTESGIGKSLKLINLWGLKYTCCHWCSLLLLYHKHKIHKLRTAQNMHTYKDVQTQYHSWHLHSTVSSFHLWILWLTARHKLVLVRFSATTCFCDACLDVWQRLEIFFQHLQESVMQLCSFSSEFKAAGFTKHYGNVKLCVLTRSCLQNHSR